MDFVRTPDTRFESLKDFSFAPNYTQVDAGDGTQLRMHYVDEGEGEVILCLHGQPSWSYLYRKMIPIFVAHGYRVVAPDLIGFGKSDKPVNRSDYSFASHVSWMKQFLESLSLNDINLVCQDWGSLIGLRLVGEECQRFSRVVLSNGGLPDGTGLPGEPVVTEELAPILRNMLSDTPALPPEEMRDKVFGPMVDRPPFMYWIKHCDEYADFHPAEVMKLFLNDCDEEEYRAWAAPFPSGEYLAGARQFPSLVPMLPDDPSMPANRSAWEVLSKFEKPFLTVFSENDPVTKDGEKRFIEQIPGAKGQAHIILEGAAHFIQDDAGAEFADHILEFVNANPN